MPLKIASSRGTYTGPASINNTVAPPVTAPNVPPFQPPKPLGYVPPAPGTFGGKAPTATPMGEFTAPDPTTFQTDPSYQWRLSQGMKALQRGAAARGTLLTGGTATALQDYGQGAASQEYGNAYDRALRGYTTNRDTNAQNFGQQMGEFQGNLGAFNANTGATLGAGRLGLDAATAGYDRDYRAARDTYEDRAANILRNTDAINTNADRTAANDYQAQIAEYQRQLDQARQPIAAPAPSPQVTRRVNQPILRMRS